MSKDQAIGGAILVVCVVVAVVYTIGLFGYQQLIQPWLNIGSAADVRFWLIAVPVFVAFVAILMIGAWIGYTMATTPPPKPIEEITTEQNKNDKPQPTQ
jgi:predicted DNA-binding transcriptional regulator